MTFIISPEYTLMFLNILLLSGFITLYILYLRHERGQSKKLAGSNIQLIKAVNGLVKTLDKAIEQKIIDRAIAESHQVVYEGEPKVE